MQISSFSQDEVLGLAKLVGDSCIDVLYFADSLGSLTPDGTSQIVRWLRTYWAGPIGIHTHDNIGLALSNTLCAQSKGVSWLDVTITGMGRGPGNARTEELMIEMQGIDDRCINIVPLMSLIQSDFGPMKTECGWGTNPYYYIAGKNGIHPSYVQNMLNDNRYVEEDIIAVLDHLSAVGGKQFSFDALNGALQFYRRKPSGTWAPKTMIKNRDVLILGSGPGLAAHRGAIEKFVRHTNSIVLALNTQSDISSDLIDFRVACHPVRLLADVEVHRKLPEPLIAPVSMLPKTLVTELEGKELLDFGLGLTDGAFAFHETCCLAPKSLVLAYALAIATSGLASRIALAGFDGYERGDTRNDEVEDLLHIFSQSNLAIEVFSITPTQYRGLLSRSVYAI
jgi:4-hydroxy 2-oxovalerate aldolase